MTLPPIPAPPVARRPVIPRRGAAGIVRRARRDGRALPVETYVAMYDHALPFLTAEERDEFAPTRRQRVLALLRWAREDNPYALRMIDAVESVVARHAPEPIEGAPGRVFCAGCGADITGGECPDVAAFADVILGPPPPDDGPPF